GIGFSKVTPTTSVLGSIGCGTTMGYEEIFRSAEARAALDHSDVTVPHLLYAICEKRSASITHYLKAINVNWESVEASCGRHVLLYRGMGPSMLAPEAPITQPEAPITQIADLIQPAGQQPVIPPPELKKLPSNSNPTLVVIQGQKAGTVFQL